jgi:hypothetical protein
MAIDDAWRGNGPRCYEFISPEELFAYFTEIQARGLLGHSDKLQAELNRAAGSNSQ